MGRVRIVDSEFEETEFDCRLVGYKTNVNGEIVLTVVVEYYDREQGRELDDTQGLSLRAKFWRVSGRSD